MKTQRKLKNHLRSALSDLELLDAALGEFRSLRVVVKRFRNYPVTTALRIAGYIEDTTGNCMSKSDRDALKEIVTEIITKYENDEEIYHGQGLLHTCISSDNINTIWLSDTTGSSS